MRRRLTIIACALSLTSFAACTHSEGSIDGKTVVQVAGGRAAADPRLLRPCRQPAPLTSDLDDGGVSAGAIERKIATDAAALRDCRARHGALVAYEARKDRALAGEKPR